MVLSSVRIFCGVVLLLTACGHDQGSIDADNVDLGASDRSVAMSEDASLIDAALVDATMATDAATSITLPAEVIAAGCTKQIFFDDFDDLSTIYAGTTPPPKPYNWYTYNADEGNAVPIGNFSTVKVGSTTAVSFDPNGGGIAGATRWAGTAMGTSFNVQGGKCLYVEGRVASGLADVSATSWPAFWMNATRHMQNLPMPWAGDTVDTSYEHYVEMDILELTPHYSYNAMATLIDWYGDYSKSSQGCAMVHYCKDQDSQHTYGSNMPGAYDSTAQSPVFHRYGALWIPSVVQSGPTQTQGAIHWFIDGVEVENPVTWTGPPSTTVYTPASPWTYSVLDTIDMSLTMNSGGGAFMYVDYAAVWQTP